MNNGQKRKPFGEAPRDISNRTLGNNNNKALKEKSHGDENPIKNVMLSSLRGKGNSGLPPSGSSSRLDATASTNSSNNLTADNSHADDSTRARLYKAQAYEAKITIAEQTQRIQALQAELEEVRLFAHAERQSNSQQSHPAPATTDTAQSTSHTNETDDAQLIEALAQELESTERDLQQAQCRVDKLEHELQNERNKRHNDVTPSIGTATTATSSLTSMASSPTPTHAGVGGGVVGVPTPPSRERELLQMTQRLTRELEKCKSDAIEGVSIMRDLERALRTARADRDAARSTRDEMAHTLDTIQQQCDAMERELGEERTTKGELLERNRELSENHAALVHRYGKLEKSLTELQNVLGVVQARSEKKMASMKEALGEAEARNEKSVVEYQTLWKRYKEVQSQCDEMETVLSEMTSMFEEGKKELATKEEEWREAEEKFVNAMEEVVQRHAEEREEQEIVAREEAKVLYEAMMKKKEEEFQRIMKEMQLQHEKELKEKIDLVNAREKQWEKIRQGSNEEVKGLKAKLSEMENERESVKSTLVAREEELSRAKSENVQLKTDKSELLRKMERGMAMYNETTSQLKAKTLELNNLSLASQNDGNALSSIQKEYETKLSQKENEVKALQSQLAMASKAVAPNSKGPDADLIAANKALKRDLTSAVESSISRGKEIQALEKEIESYQLKLTKANQKLKTLEKTQRAMSVDSEERQRFESELTTLRARAEEAEKEKDVLESEVSALRTRTDEAQEEKTNLESQINDLRANAQQTEGTISDLKEELSNLSQKVSQVQTLELDLTNARLALANSHSRIFELEEALRETELALRTVSAARRKGNSPTNSPTKKNARECRENETIRRQIENVALKEYVDQRL
ncbi:hypothetical protein HJC23_001545 [Cyclotella cryptica]|uniref:Uncharacterized protein n=1 Tax=Cyclotella cryptica TaxID=29204 RepID=A0ABD3PXA2_9STRA